MASAISDDIQAAVRDLIGKITRYEENSEHFQTLERRILTTLKKSDTMYFLTTKDIKTAVWSMAEKFMFHGFFRHADYLKKTHDKYIDRNLSESDLTPRLNIVKFLLCASENPTNNFWKNPELFDFINNSDEQQPVEDWGAYLNEGIERWSPIKDDSFCDNSDSEDSTDRGNEPPKGAPEARVFITEKRTREEYDFRECRNQLIETVQNGWFNGGTVCMEPPSDWFDARVGILYEQHLQKQVKDLIQIEPVSVISEYKVMREVLWQMWGSHSSTIFEFSINRLIPKPNVTISSVCAMTFETFLEVFLPYIELLDDFRQFSKSLSDEGVSETYRSYSFGVEKILKGVYQDLIVIEREIREQENTMTLLILAEKFQEIFQPVHILKTIHQEVIIENYQNYSALECALTLLTRLRKSLQFSVTKMEQDIRISLYLESLFYYFTMTNAWLVKNDLFDHTEEFIILNKNIKSSGSSQDRQMNFVLQEGVSEFCEQDGVIKIISDQVLQIGRNIHLLRLLGKYDVFSKDTQTIHREFLERFLEELRRYYEIPSIPSCDEDPPEAKVQKVVSSFDLNGMGDWTNFVDLSDGFLAKAFDDFYAEKSGEERPEITLFEKIGGITTNLFPLQNLPEKIFAKILKERFTISGLMVKNLLIENYGLDRQFDFLNHMFLFWDDLIFPFYRRLFEKMNTANSNWGNSVWLTSHLQDIIMDHYPNFYEDCTVRVAEFWKQCRDSLEACTLLDVQYEIKWPLSIIITDEQVLMYKELFQFILKIKWALYTVNHLSFMDLEPKSKNRKPRAFASTIKRLKYLRFNLINVLNSVQHYVFGFVFAKFRIQFELDFEKSNDLRSLVRSHEEFIKSVHLAIVEIRDRNVKEQGFQTLLKCVKMLKVMWNGLEYATGENLDICYKIYKNSFSVVNDIVNPVLVFNN